MASLLQNLSHYWHSIQTRLFPYLETEGLELTPQFRELVAILDLLRLEEVLPARRLPQVGALPKDRAALARAFVANHFLNQPDTKAFRARLLTDGTLRQICGWSTTGAVPSEATFSRAFTRFALQDGYLILLQVLIIVMGGGWKVRRVHVNNKELGSVLQILGLKSMKAIMQ